MAQKGQVIIAVGTFAAAWSIGFMMENTNATANRLTTTEVELTDVLGELDVHPTALTNQGVSAPPVRPNSLIPATPLIEPHDQSSLMNGIDRSQCDVALTAAPKAEGLVTLALSAPCFAGQQATVSHASLTFTVNLDADGNWSGKVPAFRNVASYSASVDTGLNAIATTVVPGAEIQSRVVLQWSGSANLTMAALENVDDYSGHGHVHQHDVPHLTSDVIVLSNVAEGDAKRSMVYTFAADNSDDVELVVEAAINDHTCGTNLNAELQQVVPGRVVKTSAISVTMPQCDGTEGFMVLQSIRTNAKLASL